MTPNHQNLDPKIRAEVARKSGTSTDILQALAQDPNVVVRQNVLRAAQEKENLELLELFLLDPDPVIRAELILWQDCPVPLLRRFKQDPNPAIRGIIESRLEPAQEAHEVHEVHEAHKAHEDHEDHEATKAPPEPDEPMPEQDEPTGAIRSTDKLPPVPAEAPKPVSIPTRTPTTPTQRTNPIPMRTPIAASPNPAPTYNPAPIRNSPMPIKSPVAAPIQPVPIPSHSPAPMPAPIPAPAPAPIPTPVPMPTPFGAASQPTVQEEFVEVTAPKAPSPLPGKGEIRIHLTASDKSQSELTFAKDLIVIGRVLGNDIVLAQGNVSKNHCRIFVFNDQLYIEDLKSTNGTQLNKNNITPREPHPLLESDELGVGSATLKVILSL
jgi:hypothetical protein